MKNACRIGLCCVGLALVALFAACSLFEQGGVLSVSIRIPSGGGAMEDGGKAIDPGTTSVEIDISGPGMSPVALSTSDILTAPDGSKYFSLSLHTNFGEKHVSVRAFRSGTPVTEGSADVIFGANSLVIDLALHPSNPLTNCDTYAGQINVTGTPNTWGYVRILADEPGVYRVACPGSGRLDAFDSSGKMIASGVDVVEMVASGPGVFYVSTYFNTSTLLFKVSRPVVYVHTGGYDTNAGNWGSPKGSIAGALAYATKEVRVSTGIFNILDTIQLPKGVSLVGAYTSNFNGRDLGNKTTLKAATYATSFTMLEVLAGNGASNRIEGFQIELGDGSNANQTALWIRGSASPRIFDNTIGMGTISSSGGNTIAILIEGGEGSVPLIYRNRIYGNASPNAMKSYAIKAGRTDAIIAFNDINGGTAKSDTGISHGFCIQTDFACKPVLANNYISGGSSSYAYCIYQDIMTGGCVILNNYISSQEPVTGGRNAIYSSSTHDTIADSICCNYFVCVAPSWQSLYKAGDTFTAMTLDESVQTGDGTQSLRSFGNTENGSALATSGRNLSTLFTKWGIPAVGLDGTALASSGPWPIGQQ